jgi:hypothetical protein
LYRPQVVGPAVDQGRLRAAQRVGSIGGRIQSDRFHPQAEKPKVRPGRDVW